MKPKHSVTQSSGRGIGKIIRLLLLLAILTTVTWLVYQEQTSRTLTYHSGSLTKKWEEKLTATPAMTSDSSFSVYAPAVKSTLRSVKTRITMARPVEEGSLILTVYSESGEVLAEDAIDLSLHNSGDTLTFHTEALLQKNSIYEYRFTIETETPWTDPVIGFLYPSETTAVPDERSGNAVLDGQELSGSIEMVVNYNYLSYSTFPILILADLLVLLLFLLGERMAAFLFRWKWLRITAGWLLWLVTPAVVYYLTQRICRLKWEYRMPRILWSLLFYYLLHVFLSVIVRKIKYGSSLYILIVTLLALTNYLVNQVRGKPLMILDFTDIGTAATVAGNYSFVLPITTAMLLLLCLTLILITFEFQTLEFPRTRKGTFSRALVLAASLASLITFYSVKLTSGWMTGHDFWSLNRYYMRYGYLTTLLAEINLLKVEVPEGYSVEAVQEAADRIKETAEETAEDTMDDASEDTAETSAESAVNQPVNLIVIMNESFWDPDTMGNLQTNDDILPFWTSLENEPNVTSGLLYVPVFGAGTANSEYEMLTGNTMLFLAAGTTAYEVYCDEPEYSLVSTLSSQGYSTLAIHPNKGTAWNREKVYSYMGFEEFLTTENWVGDLAELHGYVSDASVYKQIMERYDNKEEGEKLFTFCVTIQNHGGYKERAGDGFKSSVKLNYNSEYPKAEMFLSLMKESDSAFEDLITYFRDVDEPTMVVMFGDHQPKIENQFYSELKSSRKDSSIPGSESKYVTSYKIWTNYDREYETSLDMSANYLGAYVLDQAGLEMTEYEQFVLEMMEQIPQVGVTGYRDAEGVWHSYADDNSADELSASWLSDYNYLEYNNSLDRSNRLDSIFTLWEDEAGETGETESEVLP